MFTDSSPLVLIESYAAVDGQKKVEKKKTKLTTGILSMLLSLLQCRKRMKQKSSVHLFVLSINPALATAK